MGRTAGWVLNALLFVVCCALGANIVNTAIAAMLTPAPETIATGSAVAAPDKKSWTEHSQIVSRNLFHSATLAPVEVEEVVVDEEEELEATKLPLKLLGTAAASDPDLSWAAIEDLQKRETLTVRRDDEIRNGAIILRIERRRIVLDEKGVLRELALDEEEVEEEPSVRRRKRGRGGKAAKRDRGSVSRKAVSRAVANPTSLFTQARILPKYEDGEIVGLQINDPKPDSVFEKAGIETGEIITEVNGVRIDSAEESRRVMTELAQKDEWTVVVEGDGGSRTLTIGVED